MANEITTYAKIAPIREELVEYCGKLRGAVSALLSDAYITKGGVAIAEQTTDVEKAFNHLDNHLSAAESAANALGSRHRWAQHIKLQYGLSCRYASKGIQVKKDILDTNIMTIRNIINGNMEPLCTKIQSCRKELESIDVSEQLVSSLNVLDVMYPMAGLTKVAAVFAVIKLGITNLQAAEQNLNRLIQYFRTLEDGLSGYAAFFECEKKYFENLEKKLTKGIHSAGIRVKGDATREKIEGLINEYENAQAQYVSQNLGESQMIKDEIARLRKLVTAGLSAEELSANVGAEMQYIWNGNLGQCVGYAAGRFQFLYPEVNLITDGNAYQWLDKNSTNESVSVIRGGWEILENNLDMMTIPCVMVTAGNSDYQHVSILEGVDYDESGNIANLYFSESNGYNFNTGIGSADGIFTPGIDGLLQKVSIATLKNNPPSKPLGFICPKE